MKVLKYSFILILVLFIFSPSCTDLDVATYSEVTEKNFEPTKENLDRLILPVYTELRWFNEFYGYVPMQEWVADSYAMPIPDVTFFITPPFIPLQRHAWSDDNSIIIAAWEKMHNGVAAANRVLHQVNNSLELPERLKTEAVAELKAIRAFYHYLLMDNFGSIPLFTEYKTTDPVEQLPRWKVYDFVVQELKDAIPDLPAEVNDSTYGRITQWAAKVLLARVYLNSEIYAGTSNYDKVIVLADEIINSGHFKLDQDYKGPFNRSNQNSPEIIWAVPYDEENAPGNMFHMYTIPPELQPIYQMQTKPWGGSRAIPKFIDTYNKDDTRLENTWLSGPQITPKGDTAVNFVKNVPNLKGVSTHHGYPAHKFEIYKQVGISSDVDFPIYRLTEVLMMKAEALLRTGSPGEAAQIVTRVRERAFAGTDPAKAVVTAAELQSGSSYNYGLWEDGQVVNAEGGDDIKYGRFLDELGWEFALEGHRRQDLIRFGVFSRKSWFKKSPSEPCKTIFPIPENALSENPNLEQHPCYN